MRMGKSQDHATPATVLLHRAGVPFTLHRYAAGQSGTGGGHPPEGYGRQAARALGVDPTRMLKTLVVATGRRLVVGVVPVAAQLDLKALAAATGARKAVLASAVDARRSTGYVVGGISPLGQRTVLPTVVEASATRFSTVFVSAGRRGLEVELDPAVLIELTGATLADLCR